PEAHCERSRQRMKERLLLHRVQLQSAHVTVWNEQLSTAVESDPANPVKTIKDDAAVATGVTTDATVLEALVESAFGGEGLQDVFKCGYFRGHTSDCGCRIADVGFRGSPNPTSEIRRPKFS